MRKNKKKLKFIQIEWIDAEDWPGHITSKKLPKAPHYLSSGWLLKETKESYYLVATHGLGKNENGTLMQIPKGMVVNKKVWPKLTI